jgi:hypothetical protein
MVGVVGGQWAGEYEQHPTTLLQHLQEFVANMGKASPKEVSFISRNR